MKRVPLCASFLQLLAGALTAEAQTPGPRATPSPNPAEKRVPPEVAPASPAPDNGTQKSAETAPPPSPVSPGSRTPKEPEEPSEQRAVDSLSPAELDQVLSLIKERYVAPSAVSEPELKRATVQGVLDRLGSAASLTPQPTVASTEPSPFRSEVIDNRIGYLRLGAINPQSLAELDTALKGFSDKGLSGLIVDLRATPASYNFEQAAEVCRRFAPKGKVLFSIRKPNTKQAQMFTSKDTPRFHGLTAVLTDADCAGAAEIIAAVLRSQADAMVIGQKTKGEAAEFAEMPLASGKLLRLAVSEVVLPDNTSLIPSGVKPDLAVDVTPEATTSLLKQELEKGVAPLVFETERAKMNEAALVAGTNPELDAAIAARAHGERPRPIIRDAALQRAVDFITSVSIYQRTAPAK